MSDSDSDEEAINGTPPFIKIVAKETYESLLPQKSKEKYEHCHKKFMEWFLKNKIKSVSENVLTAYFKQLSTEIKPSTLWTTYSMLKTMINIKNNIDISSYPKLRSFLKLQSSNYKSKKSKILTPEQIKEFLLKAPDEVYLFTKIVLIFGISGGCRRQELKNLKINHIRDLGDEYQVKLVDTKTKTDRSFVIPGTFYKLAKKYILLRPPNMEPFFLNYQKGKCTKQVVGINKIGNQPKIIANFLKLPHANLYTGHCFRRSGATILADAGGDTLTVKNFGGWKSTAVMETYIENSIKKKKKEIANTLVNSINTTNTIPEIEPLNSRQIDQNFIETMDTTNPENQPSTSKQNLHQNFIEARSSSEVTDNFVRENITYSNCTFHNCNFIVKNQ